MKPYERDAILWLACRHDIRHIKTDLLSTVSRTAIHYGIGPIDMVAIFHPEVRARQRVEAAVEKDNAGCIVASLWSDDADYVAEHAEHITAVAAAT